MKHLVLYGPPGTGKTRRLLNIIQEYVTGSPGRVLFCSHTRAAAQEAMSRWPSAYEKRVDIQTVHSVCFRALGMSKAQTVDHLKLDAFGQEYGIDMTKEGQGPEFMEVLDMARARRLTLEQGYERSWKPGSESSFMAFCLSYLGWKKAYGYIDFTDMLEQSAQRLTSGMLTYDLVAIDEAQDCTPLHWQVIEQIRKVRPKARLIVAGDDDQALYGFAGADPAGMPKFADEARAESQILSQSYRITKPVYDLAQAIIARVVNRVPKQYAPRTGFDGRSATGDLQVWPHFEYMEPSRTRDTLILYADRFVRAEVEPMLQDGGFAYRALNGWPSPLDTRAGRAYRTVMANDDAIILDSDELRSAVKNGLTGKVQQAWDMVNPREIIGRIRRGDMSILQVKASHVDYLRAVDHKATQNIRISTMHSAKGLEADDVHLVLSLSPRAWSEAAIEPDHLHRLLYTAVTRAKENLYLYDGENGYELPERWK